MSFNNNFIFYYFSISIYSLNIIVFLKNIFQIIFKFFHKKYISNNNKKPLFQKL